LVSHDNSDYNADRVTELQPTSLAEAFLMMTIMCIAFAFWRCWLGSKKSSWLVQRL